MSNVPAAEIVNGDRLAAFLVESVGQGRGGRLVDDAQHLEAGDLAGVFRCLALGIVEVRGHGNHRLGHLLAQVRLRRILQLAQHHRRNFGRGIPFAANLHVDDAAALTDVVRRQSDFFADFVRAPTHETLDRMDRGLRVGHRLPFRGLPYEPLAALGEGHHRRRRAAALLIGDYGRLPRLHYGDN